MISILIPNINMYKFNLEKKTHTLLLHQEIYLKKFCLFFRYPKPEDEDGEVGEYTYIYI